MMTELKNFLRGLDDTSPFVTMATDIQRELDQSCNRVARNLQSDIKAILRQVMQQFDAILAVTVKGPQENAARRELAPALDHAMTAMERIMAELATIKTNHGLDAGPTPEDDPVGWRHMEPAAAAAGANWWNWFRFGGSSRGNSCVYGGGSMVMTVR